MSDAGLTVNVYRIPDPFVDMNELASRWVAEKSWTYRTTFATPTRLPDDGRTDLVFKGLDTFATVTLNGHEILEADNMFLEYRVDVTSILRRPSKDASASAGNVLEIVFDSALLCGRELVKQHEHEHDFIAHQTENSRLPVRKTQCHWGWDWGPILITAGPWKPILLESYVFRFDDVWFQGDVSDDLVTVAGKLYACVEGAGKRGLGDVKVKFELSLDDKAVFQSSQVQVDEHNVATADFKVEDPALWYPHGYGKQTLYQLKATLTHSGKTDVLTSKTKAIGFRRCKLVQELDEFGKSFYFRINNLDVFAGGSCWIPADSFLPRIGEAGYRKWMELMVEGNQIMTRRVSLPDKCGPQLTSHQDLGRRHLRRRRVLRSLRRIGHFGVAGLCIRLCQLRASTRPPPLLSLSSHYPTNTSPSQRTQPSSPK
jgi:beta-mannosidase